jgi:hypothetical protein
MRLLKANLFGAAGLLVILFCAAPAHAQRPGAGSPAPRPDTGTNANVYCCLSAKTASATAAPRFRGAHSARAKNIQAVVHFW